MDRAKRNRWSEQIAQQIARDCLQWTENGAFLDIQRTAAIVRAGQAMRPQFGAADARSLQDWLGVTGSIMTDESWDKLDYATRRLYVSEIVTIASE
jgi:predicted TIM-barrel fold metal-dependent hydrolase